MSLLPSIDYLMKVKVSLAPMQKQEEYRCNGPYFSVLGLDQDLHRQQRGQAFSKPCDYGSSGGMVQ